MTISDVESIRKQFPALERTHAGKAVAYFDAPGGTQVPRSVGDAMVDYLFHHNANTHWAYPTSAETDVIIEEAREAAGALLNASPREIVFGANMTTLTFHLARALGRTWAAGDEVIVTELDHHANVAPWRALEVERGIVIRTVRMIPATAQLDYEHLSQLAGPRTRLLAIGAASNAVGTINDLARARAVASDVGALLFVDAVHLTPHELVDVRKIGCDFLGCSSYKFYGPHAGVLFARQALLESLPFPKLQPAPDSAPDRGETGTQNHEGIAGIAATVRFLASLDGSTEADAKTLRSRLQAVYAALHDRGLQQLQRLWQGLSAIPGIHLYGPLPSLPRTPTIGFTVAGKTAEEVCRALAREGLFLSHGDFYATTVIERLGVEALVRAGAACYTTDAEIDRLIQALERLR